MRVDGSASIKYRHYLVNRVGGTRQRKQHVFKKAVVSEIDSRPISEPILQITTNVVTAPVINAEITAQAEEAPTVDTEKINAQAGESRGTQAHLQGDGAGPPCYPTQYAVENEIIDAKMVMEDMDIRSMTTKNEIKAGMVNAIQDRPFFNVDGVVPVRESRNKVFCILTFANLASAKKAYVEYFT